MVNEPELIEELDKYEFDSYILEDISFRDQVKLLSGAEIIVDPHGAGFTNTIYVDNLILLELFGSDELSYSLCSGLPTQKDPTTPLSECPNKK